MTESENVTFHFDHGHHYITPWSCQPNLIHSNSIFGMKASKKVLMLKLWHKLETQAAKVATCCYFFYSDHNNQHLTDFLKVLPITPGT